jgi:hypothetical protein
MVLLFGRACLQASYSLDKGTDIPEFVALQYLASLNVVRKQRRDAAVHNLTAFISSDLKFSMLVVGLFELCKQLL